METIGLVTVLVAGAGVVVAGVLVALSLPDLNRYRRLKKM